jgi:hypothetical protein
MVAIFFFVQYTKPGKNIPKWGTLYQMAGKLTKSPNNILTSAIARPSKIYPDRDFLVCKYTIWQP